VNGRREDLPGADADAGDFNLRGRFRPRLRGDSRRCVSEHGRQEKNEEKKRQGDCGTKWLPARYGQCFVHGTHPRQRSAQDSRPRSPRPGPPGYHTPGLSSTQPQMVAHPGSASKQLGNLYPMSFRRAAPPLPGGRSSPFVCISSSSCTRASRLHICHRQRGLIPLHLPASCARYSRPISHIHREIIFDDDTRLDAHRGYDTASQSLRLPLPTSGSASV
jgi:hypothetical protein